MTDYAIDPTSPVPKYFQVYSALLNSIETGEYGPGAALPYAHELTESFGVSRITITKVMDMLESDGIIERHQGKGIFVLDRQPASQRTSDIIALINDLGSAQNHCERQYLWSAIVHGLEDKVAAHSIKLQLAGAIGSDSAHMQALQREVDGVIFYPGSEIDPQRHSLVKQLTADGFPIILVDRYYRDLESDCVLFDDEKVGFQLTEALIKKGHQRIAFALTTEPHVTSVEDRLRGYRRALETHNLTYHEELVLELYSQLRNYDDVDLEPVNTHFELREIVERYQVTAVFTANDLTTEKLIFDKLRLEHDQLQEQDLPRQKRESNDIPTLRGTSLEIAMIGEAIPLHYRNYVSLVAKQSGYKIGVAAADLLIGRINGTITGPSQTVIVPMEIIAFDR